MAINVLRINLPKCFGQNQKYLIRGLLATQSSRGTYIKNPTKSLCTSSLKKSDKELFQVEQNSKQGSQHWMTERVVVIGLLAAVPAAICYPTPLVDHCLAVLLPLHAYWGMNRIIGDYLFRPLVPVTKFAWGAACVVSLAGLIYLNVHDVGICKFVAMAMSL